MRGFFWFAVLSGVALWLDDTYCSGQYTQAAIQMFNEMTVHM